MEPQDPIQANAPHPQHDQGKEKRASQLVVREVEKQDTGSVGSSPGGWPEEPRRLQRSVTSHVFIRGWDFITLLLPVPFLVLAGFAMERHGKLVNNEDWSKLQRATEVAVTAFPIFFAVIMGRLTRAIAAWRLERGTPLGALEQLLGSSTLGSAVMTHWALRSYNLLGLCLILVWALSPLGGQSSLHILSTGTQALTSTVGLSFLSTRLWPALSYSNDLAVYASQTNAIYLSALLAPESSKLAAMDTWGNVKIPSISSLGPADNSTGWRDVNTTAEIVYTSLLGIPTYEVPRVGNTSFSLETSYYDLDCFDLHLQKEPDRLADGGELTITKNNQPLKITMVPHNKYIGSNGSELCSEVGCLSSFGMGMDRYISNRVTGDDSLFPNVTDNTSDFLSDPPVFMFQSRSWNLLTDYYDWTTVARCHLTRLHVEASIHCAGQSADTQPHCAVTALRDSRIPHPPRDATPFLLPITMIHFAESISTAGGYGHSATASLTERYLNNSADPLSADVNGFDLSTLPRKTFSQRLTQLFNTYYLCSIRPESMTGNLWTSMNSVGRRHIANLTASHAAWEPPRYRVSAGWLTCFILATVTMLVGAILTTLTIHRTVIPDVLGYVSSMTRHAPDSTFPPGATTLDGLERSRLLRDVPVRLGDVRPDDKEAGHLAFSVANLAERACRGRFYD